MRRKHATFHAIQYTKESNEKQHKQNNGKSKQPFGRANARKVRTNAGLFVERDRARDTRVHVLRPARGVGALLDRALSAARLRSAFS